MKLFRSQLNQPLFDGCALSIGCFDGIHRGHAAIIQTLCEQAKQRQLPAGILLFEPQPQEFFNPQQAPARLSRFSEKLMQLKKYPLDFIVCYRFNQGFSELSAQTFIDQLLLKQLGVRYLLVGEDFRFGHKRQGDRALLQQASVQSGFDLDTAPTLIDARKRISSSRIRTALADGQFEEAKRLLGHPYMMTGRVVHGDKIGHQLGFPTVNLPLFRTQSPLWGVYVVQVHGVAEHTLPGVASVGYRPAVNGKKMLLEVHLFDFNDSLYGRKLSVEFLHKLRDEADFPNLDALRDQIAVDVAAAKSYFSS